MRPEEIRPPAVAGLFYPGDRSTLLDTVDGLLEAAGPAADPTPPRAAILPHAGYPYSGPTAARGYAALAPRAGEVERVVVIGPSHFVPFAGIAASRAKVFMTPLGEVPVDREAVAELVAEGLVGLRDDAHEREHGLEVHLPFIQQALGEVHIVPLVTGRAEAHQVAPVLERLWRDETTLVVASSDLSHFHDDATARRLDEATSQRIEALDYPAIDYQHACGRDAIHGLLEIGRARGLRPETRELTSSAAATGDRSRVVGYGCYLLH